MKLRTLATIAVAAVLALPPGGTAPAVAGGMSMPPSVTKPADDGNLVEPVRRRGRDIAIGLGILGAAIVLTEAARAEGRRRYRRDSYCGRQLYLCDEGSDRACERYYENCM
jgi:hypothetical protein